MQLHVKHHLHVQALHQCHDAMRVLKMCVLKICVLKVCVLYFNCLSTYQMLIRGMFPQLIPTLGTINSSKFNPQQCVPC